MQTVVSEGTGVGGAVDGYDVAGKTGTAERADENGGYLKENYMSSFMGFAPAQSPKVLCYITLDGTPSGSDAAAVPFQSIMANALDVLGIPHTKYGVTIFGAWFVVPYEGCSHALHHACAAL